MEEFDFLLKGFTFCGFMPPLGISRKASSNAVFTCQIGGTEAFRVFSDHPAMIKFVAGQAYITKDSTVGGVTKV